MEVFKWCMGYNHSDADNRLEITVYIQIVHVVVKVRDSGESVHKL